MHCFCVIGSVFACGLKKILLIDDRTSTLPIICQKSIQRLWVRVDNCTTILLRWSLLGSRRNNPLNTVEHLLSHTTRLRSLSELWPLLEFLCVHNFVLVHFFSRQEHYILVLLFKAACKRKKWALSRLFYLDLVTVSLDMPIRECSFSLKKLGWVSEAYYFHQVLRSWRHASFCAGQQRRQHFDLNCS